MEFLSTIVDFLFNKERSILGKLGFITLITLVPFGIELGSGVFSIWLNSQRISQIEKIETVLSNKQVPSETRDYLRSIEADLVRKGWIKSYSFQDLGSDFVSLIQNTMYSAKSIMPKESANKKPNMLIVSERQVYLHTISSGWTLILAMAAMPFFLFSQKFEFANVVAFFVMELTAALGVAFFAYIFSFIPIIGSGRWNIIINLFLNFILVGGASYLSTRSKRHGS